MILTRCPNCSTVFRVTPEQLRVRHGQVRCGSCYATFNALSELSEDLPPPRATPDARDMAAAAPFGDGQAEAPTVSDILPPVAAPPEPGSAWSGEEIEYIDIGSAAPAEPDISLTEAASAAQAKPVEPADASTGDVAGGAAGDAEPTMAEQHPAAPDGGAPVIETAPPTEEASPAADEATGAALEAAVGETTVPESPEPPAEPPFEAEPPAHTDAETPAIIDFPPAETAARGAEHAAEHPAESPTPGDALPEPPASPEPPDVKPAIAPGPPPPGFGADARPPSQWPWWAGAALALVALAAQAVIHFRTELAVRHPDARPALEALCAPFGCDIPLPAKIGLMEIGRSDRGPHE
ncbi:MAG: zinc-ribbon domain-containing protein, partial [Hyphomicrobiales bacterium]|nr:zinc-ribbon domain-containing protein [Hyphomicrobiales bacterium]